MLNPMALGTTPHITLLQALKQNGVEKFSPLGEKFDPNVHSALFQIPDADKDAGTVLVVTKVICSMLCCKSSKVYCGQLYVRFCTSVQETTSFMYVHTHSLALIVCPNLWFVQSGYTLNGRVVRPAEVGVSTQP